MKDTRKTLLTREGAQRYEVELADYGFETDTVPIYGMGSIEQSRMGWAVLVSWDGDRLVLVNQEQAHRFLCTAQDSYAASKLFNQEGRI